MNPASPDLLAKWRPLLEPVLLGGLSACGWDDALAMHPELTERGESVLMTVDGQDDARTRTVLAAAGHTPDVLALVAESEERARQRGMTRMAYVGRAGWQRAARDYKVVAVIGLKEL